MYIGKMFVTNHSTLRWDYHTDKKKDSFANIPQVFGFVNTAYYPPLRNNLNLYIIPKCKLLIYLIIHKMKMTYIICA